MSATLTVKLERELWELFRPFYQYPDQAVKEIAVAEMFKKTIGEETREEVR